MSNQINELSPNIRDFLLNRNLIVSDTISNNGLSDVAFGLGTQASIQDLANSVQASEDIEVSSIDYRNTLVSRNQYTSIEDMVQATIINNSFSYNQVNGGYIENNGELNIGGPSTDALDTITSITSGEGFGLGEGGFFPNNNVNTSITGRVLGGIGVINDTPLGIIGGQQLLLAFKQRVSANAQRELFGKVNLQPFSLLRGAQFLNPDYSITVSSSTGGRILDTAVDLTGFELPIAKLDAGTSIFDPRTINNNNIALFQPDSVTRNNAMIRNTGKGQILRLFEVLNQNKFKPEYESDRNDDKLGIENPLEYKESNFLVGPENAVSLKSDEAVPEVGDALWSNSTLLLSTDNSLISKTKALFENKDLNLYDSMFNNQNQDLSRSSKLTTPNGKYKSTDKWLSKGSGVLSEGYLFDGDTENVFCRTWNSTVSYDNRSALQKNTGLKESPNRFRRNVEKSVLDSNGFVKITPYNVPSNGTGDADAKKFMFSIENLAWNDRKDDLPNFETGPGDPITGTKGRIMWFPPYDIKFNETTNVNWDKTSFIGRGEPIYTYNNTERSGQLSFKIIIDHPDYLNDKQNLSSDEIITSIAAGCTDYERFFSPNEFNRIQTEIDNTVPAGNSTIANDIETPNDFDFYFPNDVASISDTYEKSGSGTTQVINSEGYNAESGTPYDNGTNIGLNDYWNNQTNIDAIKEALVENEGITIIVNSYASNAGNNIDNQRLSDIRLSNVIEWLKANISTEVLITSKSNGSGGNSDPNASPADLTAKKERKVTIEFEYDASLDPLVYKTAEIEKDIQSLNKEFVTKVKRRFFKESEYFDKLESSDSAQDKFIYQTIKEKIKFFQPAFHSTTPEGFNSRLTFLQQCTRQGPTDSDRRANNLAFGAPPVCILRIGDFYNTKIVVTSLNFTFEPLVWDLNPEGVGVQPMITNVQMNFNFIGGSSLTGPINKLQNAVSFNYFANTEVYDPRADTIVPKEDGEGFEISGGTKNLRDFLEDDDYFGKKDKQSNKDLDKDQGKQAEDVNTGDVPEPSSETVSDLDIIKNIAWTVSFNEVGKPNTFTFTFNGGFGYNITGLNKNYTYRLDIKNETGTFQNVLNGTFGDVNSGSNVSTTIWSQGIYGIGYQSFKLTINGIVQPQTLKIDVETGLYHPTEIKTPPA